MVKIFPVIHVASVTQVLREMSVAVKHPVDGVFLIDHDANDARLLECIRAARSEHTNLFLGANFIRRPLLEALDILARAFGRAIPLDAIWADDAGLNQVTDGNARAQAEARTVSDAISLRREQLGWAGQYFGGVAFKYQAPVAMEFLPRLGEVAGRHVDVPTTSGPGTGQAAETSKLHALRVGLGMHPLALASGITPDNVGEYVGLVDHILVSSGITNPVGNIDEDKLARLLENVRARPTS